MTTPKRSEPMVDELADDDFAAVNRIEAVKKKKDDEALDTRAKEFEALKEKFHDKDETNVVATDRSHAGRVLHT